MGWTRHKQLLGELLIELGLITEQQLSRALAEQRIGHERIGETLVRLGYLERQQLAVSLSEQYVRRMVGALGVAAMALQPGLAAAGSVRGQMTVSATVVNTAMSDARLIRPVTPASPGSAAVTLSCLAVGRARIAVERGTFASSPATAGSAGNGIAPEPSYVVAWRSASSAPVTCSSGPQSITAPLGLAAATQGLAAVNVVITY